VSSIPDGPIPAEGASGPLHGLRVVELASEWTAFAGKLLAELGAEVILVEATSGAPMRDYGPFAGDSKDREASLWWGHYQTSKLGVTLDLDEPDHRDRFLRMLSSVDMVLEGEAPGRLARLGIDHPERCANDPALIWISITPFGRDNPRAAEPATDLTLLAGGGPVWSCGYDDHTLPPVRGGGNQAMHTGGLHAVAAALAALLRREASGRGQHIDVSVYAAVNVTTEEATFRWLVAGETVERQTGRHASTRPTMPTMAPDVDGRHVNTGAPPRSTEEFTALLGWMEDLGLRDRFPDTVLLELGVERGGVNLADIDVDVEAQAIYGAGREALILIASRLVGYDFFVEGQRRGLATSLIYAPEEVLSDPHFIARGFPIEVRDGSRTEKVTHAGAPMIFGKSPWKLRSRAPQLGEHNAVKLGTQAGEAE